MRTYAQRRGRGILAALCSTALALALAALPGDSWAAPAPTTTATAQGAPARPAPGPSPDPSLPVHTLARADAPLDNPLKGFARFYQPGGNQNTGYPHALTWSYFGLSEVMKNAADCGSYDWSVLDAALDESASYGNQTALRFYIEYPGGSGSHPADAIPPCFAGHVANRTNAYWNTVSPDYDSAYLLDALKKFIAAFGARYDGDPRVGFIHMGLIGLWGEWHTWPYDTDTSSDAYPNYMPTDAHGAQIVQAYDKAFTHTKIEVRYPESAGGAADDLPAVGFHDDSFCYREGSPAAGVTLPVSMGGAGYSQLQKELDRGVENRWTTASMGGEVRPEIQPTAFASWPGGSGAVDDMKACLELEHTTWKMNEGSAAYAPDDPKVAAAVRLMGYDLGVDRAYFHDTAQGTTTIGVRMTNDGVAPFYYPWTVSLGLKDASGTVVKSWATPWDLRQVMPAKIRAFPDWGVGADPTYLDYGYARYFDTSVDLSGVAPGGYQLVMKAKNPLENVSAAAKKLRFATSGQNADGWLALGAMTVGSQSGGPHSYEAEATGNTLTGTAVRADCAGCSGGAKVGYLGNGATLTFNGVDGGTGGTRTVTVHYTTAESRTATVRANGGTAKTVAFAPTADWTTTATTTLTLDLAAGTGNTVTLANSGAWAPDIDRITVS
ncbi:carbohydrate-binding protein [Streptomyces sp. NPDC005840]|uniref:Carbohydrate-binding protein n=1 Tax=Streptomyces doudnae TaxID=3075536 RepID=A0ABD5F1W7_9ACTN|nr:MULTISPECIES: carbohydrate-binding protein [unclassified Streptomyces]MDT0440493.1 carbohydrate-binding protein [Streptomyces sp. DSM 41981]SCD88209.1 Carbohydrate binding module (family 6) [Streptomyces sp. SolWspMP-5a-2]